MFVERATLESMIIHNTSVLGAVRKRVVAGGALIKDLSGRGRRLRSLSLSGLSEYRWSPPYVTVVSVKMVPSDRVCRIGFHFGFCRNQSAPATARAIAQPTSSGPKRMAGSL